MKVEQERIKRAARKGGTTAVAVRGTRRMTSPMMDDVLNRLPPQPTRFAVCAPGRLDVMGGLADYSGSLTVSKTADDHICVAVQRCPEAALSIDLTGSLALDGNPPTVIATCDLRGSDGAWVRAEQWPGEVEAPGTAAVRGVVGAVVEMLRSTDVSQLEGGFSIAVGSTRDGASGIGGDAALVSATLLATAAAADVTLQPPQNVELCQRVLNEWLSLPVGMSDGACVLLGEPNALMQCRGDPFAMPAPLPLPGNLAIAGIDTGSIHDDAKLRYTRVRTASFMGRALIDRIVKHEGADLLQWNGLLARVSVSDYVERFRDRIPTKLKGSEFLERFGETGDPLTRVEPPFVYKIRSRTEHHIYEHARACEFVECLSRAIRNNDEQALHGAGELMYASHWSYGQRCGLGSIATDALVRLIRDNAAQAGVYGAKVSARGCGGVVVVLMRSGEKEMDALSAVMERYQAETGNKPVLLRHSLPGALVSGVERL